ncbi:Uncharacterised protein [Hafnia alvei]|uniref:Lipoprotein n=1 Tax=Hafnia alvei TaxID=569 RepID=A0A377PQ86_HAFAL|nr:Uncharacterised protein [Hafnia alvei]
MLMRSALLNNYRMIFGTALLMLVFLLTGCAKSDALWGVVDKVCRVNYQQKARSRTLRPDLLADSRSAICVYRHSKPALSRSFYFGPQCSDERH